MKRNLTAILALSILLSTVACGGDPGQTDTTTAGGDDTTEQTGSGSGVPAGTDLNKAKVTIWYTTTSSSAAETFVDLNPEATGDVLDDAIYNANAAVEERLNVELDYYKSPIATSDVGAEIQKLMVADDNTYDLFNTVEWNSATLAAEGLFLNIKDMPYLSLDEDWWDYEYMKEMTIGDNLYTLVGDYAVDRTRCLNCFFYNKNIYGDFTSDPDGLYKEVLDGKWTLDRMTELAAMAFNDLNSDGKPDTGDRLGLILNKENLLDGFFYGSGLKTTKRNAKDEPELIIMNERASDIYDKVYRIVSGEYEGVYTIPKAFDQVANLDKITRFNNGTILFLPGFLYSAENLREMRDEYGIIPYPKADEAQSDYYSIVHNIIREMALPTNCKQPENVCAVLEELAFEGNQNVIPAYYEVALKTKYARDDDSAKMLDMIRDGCVTDIAMIYPANFNRLGIILRYMAQENKASLATIYAERESAAKEQMATFIEGYTKG